MAAEMAEQPAVIERLVQRRDAIKASIAALLPEHLCGTVLLARGSSDTAALYGRYLFDRRSARARRKQDRNGGRRPGRHGHGMAIHVDGHVLRHEPPPSSAGRAGTAPLESALQD